MDDLSLKTITQRNKGVCPMKKTMTVQREQLLTSIQAIAPGLSPKELIEQSSCFVIIGNQIASFNDEITCRAPSPFPKKFHGAVPADKITRILEKIKDDELKTVITDGRMTFTGKKDVFWLRMSHEVSLPVEKVKLPKKWHKLPNMFIDAVTIVQECASKADEKTGRTAIHISPTHVEAWDGYQMARFNLKFKRLKDSVLIRKPTLTHVINMGVTHYGETSNWFHFKNASDHIISCRRLVEEYEEIEHHFEVKGKKIVLPKGLAEAADKAGIFSEGDKELDLAVVSIKNGKIYVTSTADTGGYRGRNKAKFKGEDMEFTIPPTLLKELVHRHNEAILAPGRLKVDGGNWCYVTALGNPEDLTQGDSDGDSGTDDDGSDTE